MSREFASIEEILNSYKTDEGAVCSDSNLMRINHTLSIAPDKHLLSEVMALRDNRGNPIECQIKFGLANIFWDGILGYWLVQYPNKNPVVSVSARNVEVILSEAQRAGIYGDIGGESHPNFAPEIFDAESDFYLEGNDYAV